MKLNAICDRCQAGRMKAARTITCGSSRTRYLRCTACGATGKEVLRIDPTTGRPVESGFFLIPVSTRGNAESSQSDELR
jgi:hypothetical protein